MIGLPYAEQVAGGVICPECDRHISEDHDAYGERTTNNYADHFAACHALEQGEAGDDVAPNWLRGEGWL